MRRNPSLIPAAVHATAKGLHRAGGMNRSATHKLTRPFAGTVRTRVRSAPKFRNDFLTEGVEAMRAGDAGSGKSILRDYIEAMVGYQQLGAETGSLDGYIGTSKGRKVGRLEA